MRDRNRSLAVLSALLLGAVASAGAWGQAALAQASPPELPTPGQPGQAEGGELPAGPGAPALEAPRDSVPPPTGGHDLSTEAGRAAELDALFAQLAEAEEGPHARIEQRIQQLLSRSGSDTMDLLLMRGRAAMADADMVKAIQHFSALTDHAPGFAEGWNMRATAFFMNGDIGMALADLEHVLALEPRHFGALYGLGVIMEQIDRPADALAAYRAAQAVDPHMENLDDTIDRLATEVDGRDI